ncbi:hypothetical protein E3T55_03635 [Cryobacterium frigoriphilum]|uniref:LPXTG cell wall anchor domain-containing protein n=1 Tax=Cryobacterium frigoriphilum TaxID=1259150 RepID=A0A4R9A9Z4_9MICO|nr:hypothetical protein [Cryobacterium frigoriphilum]TFD54525.1 hypothetical protein E3T55_03635 [Cryobacterium frigoriphilum]
MVAIRHHPVGPVARAILALALATLLALAAAAAPAAAAPIDLTLSTDGVTFSEAPADLFEGGLFDDLGLLIPRGSVSATLWVKNPTARPASLRISTRDVVFSDAAFAQVVTLSTWNSRTETAAATTLAAVDGCRAAMPAVSLAAGEVVRLVVTFTMADATGLVGQNGFASLNFLVTMQQHTGMPPQPACDDEGVLVPVLTSPAPRGPALMAHPRSLSQTGTETGPLVALALALVGAGLAVTGAATRGIRCARLVEGRNHDEHPIDQA